MARAHCLRHIRTGGSHHGTAEIADRKSVALQQPGQQLLRPGTLGAESNAQALLVGIP